MDPQDGAIAALTGGFDYFASNFNRAVQAKRQPGSAFKPFLYSAALEQGFTPASIVNDAPLVIEDPTLEGSWRPQNDSREFRGPMRLREALVRSRNLVSIRVMNALGPAYATQYIERFGFPENSLPRNLSLALGTAQVSPLEMASGVLGVRERRLPRRALLPAAHRRSGRQRSSTKRSRASRARSASQTPRRRRAASARATSCSTLRSAAPTNDETRWGGTDLSAGQAARAAGDLAAERLSDDRHDERRRPARHGGARRCS